jgi:nesprin-1
MRWERLFHETKQYMHAGDLLRNWKDYRSGVENLQKWLKSAENVLSTSQLTSTEKIKAYGDRLKKFNQEIEGIEELFKDVSKKFQTLIQDLSREEVDRMMNTLKKEKETLVKVRALIPMQLHLYHQILVQQESLEAGQREISTWLDDAEQLLNNYNLSGGRDSALLQLERHKAFFSRTLYYKSMLESKNKVLNNIVKSVDAHKKLGDSESSSLLRDLNERFSRVSQLALVWEQRLQEAVRCWSKFRDCERQISEWLSAAETLINDRNIDNRQSVEYHKNFFEKVNDRWINELVNVAQDLRNALPVEQQTPIIETVNSLQRRWKSVLSFAPLHLMKLEFRLDEATFSQYLKEIEIEINGEQQAMMKNEDFGSILKRNKDFFVNREMLIKVERSLQTLKKISMAYSNFKEDDTSLSEATQNAERRWKQTTIRVEALREQLRQVPQQWAAYKQR